MMYFYNEHFILPFSHDEVVHGKKTIIDKMYGEYEEKFAQVKALYMYMFAHPGKNLTSWVMRLRCLENGIKQKNQTGSY